MISHAANIQNPTTANTDKGFLIKVAAQYLRNVIDKYCKIVFQSHHHVKRSCFQMIDFVFLLRYYNRHNKTCLNNLLFDFYESERFECLKTLNTDEIILSGEEKCIQPTTDLAQEITELTSNQEEADTRAISYTNHIIMNSSEMPSATFHSSSRAF